MVLKPVAWSGIWVLHVFLCFGYAGSCFINYFWNGIWITMFLSVSFCEVFVNMWCWMHWIISLILIFVFLVICIDWIELIDINFLSRLFYLFLLFCLSWLSRFKCNLTLIRLPLSGMCDLMSHASETYKLQWSWSSVEGCGNDSFSFVMETNNISGFWWWYWLQEINPK